MISKQNRKNQSVSVTLNTEHEDDSLGCIKDIFKE